MKNEKETVSEENEEKETKQKKKKGKIARIYEMHQKGLSVKEIAEKMNMGERLVRSYLWRSGNPEKYAELLKRYFAKKKEKQQVKKKENA